MHDDPEYPQEPYAQPLALDDQVGFWLKEFNSEAELVDALMEILKRDTPRVERIQRALALRELDGEDGAVLSSQIRWLDGQLYFVATLKDDAESLLRKAEEFYKVPAGRSVPCVTEDGVVVRAGGARRSAKASDDDFEPKYKELTDHDRTIALKAKVVPYRRLRNEYVNLHESIIGRLIRASVLMTELRERHKAAGAGERRH